MGLSRESSPFKVRDLVTVEIQLQEESYPELYFTSICVFGDYILTAAHDESTNTVVFHLVNESLYEQVSSAWILAEPSDEDEDEDAGETDQSMSSRHIHTMKSLSMQYTNYVLAGSAVGGLHLLCVLNDRLLVLLQNFNPLTVSGLFCVRGIQPLVPEGTSTNQWRRQLSLEDRRRRFAVFGDVLSELGETTGVLSVVYIRD